MKHELQLQSPNGALAAFHTPPEGDHRGTILCLHGGPGGDHRGNDGIFDEMAEACPKLGFDVLQFDLFGVGASDGEAHEMTLASQVADYLAALDHVRATSGTPIHVAGESMGATVAALSWQEDVSSYLLLWPAFDLVDTDLRPYFGAPWRELFERDGFADDDGMIMGREFITQVQEQDYSSCFRLPGAPCLLVHGKGDTAVPFSQSVRAVTEATGPAVLFAHPSGDHGLQEPEEREFTRGAYLWWLGR